MGPAKRCRPQRPNQPRTTARFVDAQVALHRERGDDPHLRRCRAVERYHFHATDGDIGHVDFLLVDDATWAIRDLANTSNRWLGHQTLIAPPRITEISGLDATVSVDLTRQVVRDAPPYDAEALPTPEQEHGLFEDYGRPGHASQASESPFG